MPRYVILEHDHPFLHWDLMLEAGDALRTWRLLAPPAAGQSVPAQDLALHRKDYLDYEGPVSGNRGSVRRWDAGTFSWLEDATDHIIVELSGAERRRTLELTRATGNEWIATWVQRKQH